MAYKVQYESAELHSAQKNTSWEWIINALRNQTRYEDIKLGDVLIRMNNGQIQKSNNIIDKFVVVYKDADGLIYTKHIQSTSRLSKTMYCINTLSCDKYYFDVDPDRIDSVLLSNEDSYNPLLEINSHNKAKNKAKKINSKLKFSEEEAENFIKNIITGSIFYTSSLNGNRIEKCYYDGLKTNTNIKPTTASYYLVFVYPKDKGYRYNKHFYSKRDFKDFLVRSCFKEEPTCFKDLL